MKNDDACAALEKLVMSAKLLQQNAVGCATNHYGNDIELNGLPGWLTDTQAHIAQAESALASLRSPAAPAPTSELVAKHNRVVGNYNALLSRHEDLQDQNSNLREALSAQAQEIERLKADNDTLTAEYSLVRQASNGEYAETLLARAESTEKERDAREKALAFYRDEWSCAPNKRYGGLEWKPTEKLLDDCGNRARAALAEGR